MTKVELGCGATKEIDYIGVDRFDLPGVDIVADLNLTFPFEDNSVDEIWACHSLEHLENMTHVFSEIYRICKHGAIVRILAPYYLTTLNISNFYHKSAWTEDSPRLFDIYDTEMVKATEWWMPHAINWGIGRSDNSELQTVFQIVSEEFFYFPEYCHFSDDIKTQARRSMLNVCDQVYFVLVVNKTAEPFSREKLIDKLKLARTGDPQIILKLRERDKENARKNFFTIYDRVSTVEKNMLEEKKRLETISEQLYIQRKKILKDVDKHINAEIAKEKQVLKMQLMSRMSMVLRSRRGVSSSIADWNRNFHDGILLNDDYHHLKEMHFSENLSREEYLEYSVPSGFSKIDICLFSLYNTEVFFELVQDGVIVKQLVREVDGLQCICIDNNTISEQAFLRIRLNESNWETIVRVLLVEDSKVERLAYVAKY